MAKKIKKTNNSHIHTPHDKLFRRSMSIPSVAKDFLLMHLPEDIKNQIDYTTLEVLPETFIDESLSHHQVDALFKVLCGAHDTLIYVLVEQQTNPHNAMPIRQLSYKSDIWTSFLEKNIGDPNASLPPIISLHFYTGSKPYTGPLSIADLAKENADLVNQCLTQPMINVWAGDISAEQLKTHPWAATLEYIMHHRRDTDVRPVLKAIAPNIRMFYMEEQKLYVLSLYTYIENVYTYEAPIEEFARIAGEEISPQAAEDIMTIAEKLRQEGELKGTLKGELKGKLEVAKEMLDAGSDLAFIVRVTKLPLVKIKELQKIDKLAFE